MAHTLSIEVKIQNISFCQVGLFYALVILQGWPGWTMGFAPIYFMAYPFLLKGTTYHFQENALVITSWLHSKIEIPYTNIGEMAIKDASFLQQLLGLPRRMVSVDYNKYDSINIYNASPRMLRKLLRVTEGVSLVKE
ncbi:hypothetical protein [Owenweeksia hongkongensis]|uniref:hypothetical protein n=1 Tax=Owenweeksia hongkongensis TaxID=253245 RepID=UPI003A91E154